MTEDAGIQEATACFSRRDDFDRAVAALLANGIPRDRLSVLSTHEAIESVEPHSRLRDLADALVGEGHYVTPVTTAGLIALAAGPVGALISGLTAAGLGAQAVRDVIDHVTAADKSDDFARALKHGAAVLWVRVDGENERQLAEGVLAEAGGQGVHTLTRAASESGSTA